MLALLEVLVFSLFISGLSYSQTPTNGYSPSGIWKVKEDINNSPGKVSLCIPEFILNADPNILEPHFPHNNVLLYGRRDLYKNLFTELMLQSIAQDHEVAYEISKPISDGVKVANGAIKILSEVKMIDKSSMVSKELPAQLKLVALVFTIGDKVDEAGAEAVGLYATLSAFREGRHTMLQAALASYKNIDPEMNKGLESAYQELKRQQTKDLETLKKELQTKRGTEEATKGIVQMVLGSQFGTAISAIAGGGLIGGALSVALPTAWIWQLGRTSDAEQAEASLVLLSTIDQTIMDQPQSESSELDKYTKTELRAHLSFMLRNAAESYSQNSSVMSRYKDPIRNWVRNFPYYNTRALDNAKAAVNIDIGIKTPDTKDISSNIPGAMIYIEGGIFDMGNNDGIETEKPLHRISVKSYYIDKYEVTQADYEKVMGHNPSHFKCPICPVENVSWNDANEYSKIVGKRLPTEAEWEFAARGGNKSKGYKYSGSDNIDEVAWYSDNSGHKTHPVGTKQPNELGIYDMTGNIFEWCSDWYGEKYYGQSNEYNPQGPPSGTSRVLRGGSWFISPIYMRVSLRSNSPPTTKNFIGGFRCVKDTFK